MMTSNKLSMGVVMLAWRYDCPTVVVEEPESGSSLQRTSASSQSLLSRLRAPTASEITRKRKLRVNAPPHTGARKKSACASDPKGVSVAERAREVSDEMVTVSCGKLLCRTCFLPTQGIFWATAGYLIE